MVVLAVRAVAHATKTHVHHGPAHARVSVREQVELIPALLAVDMSECAWPKTVYTKIICQTQKNDIAQKQQQSFLRRNALSHFDIVAPFFVLLELRERDDVGPFVGVSPARAWIETVRSKQTTNGGKRTRGRGALQLSKPRQDR